MRVASASLVVLAVGAGLVACGGSGGAATPRVVPWRALAVHVAPVRRLAAPCRARALRQSTSTQGATGTSIGDVELTNRGRRPCSLLGRPSIATIDPPGRRQRTTSRTIPRLPADPLAGPPLSTLRALRPGERASLIFEWSNWCGAGSTRYGDAGTGPTALVLRLPRGGGALRLPARLVPTCHLPRSASEFSVTPFSRVVAEPEPRSRLPLSARIPGPLHARAGHPLRFTVVLRNRSARAFRFHGCPVYEESVADTGAGEAYVLNCAGVRAVAPGARVRFAMVLHVPRGSRAPTLVLWELAPATFEPPDAEADLRLDPPGSRAAPNG